jgi:hypothetical protein
MQAKRFGWLLLAALTAGPLPRTAFSADPSLEERVRALEKKVEQQQGQSAQQRSLQDRVTAMENEVKQSEKSITEKLGISIHGLVAVDYLYDINRPDVPAQYDAQGNQLSSGVTQPFLRSFADKKNSFILNLANLHFERQSESGLGFVADMDFGETANVVNNATFFGRTDDNGDDITGNGTDFFDARQFYLTYTIPVGSGIKLQAGRFVTLAGEEVIKSYNNLNYNITNSILFGYAIPFTHTGLMGTYAFNDQWTLSLGIVNGWDDVVDNNDGKTLHGMLTYAPCSAFSIAISGTYGPEQSTHSVTDNLGNVLVVHAGRSKRFLQTTVITAKPTDQLTLILDYDYGNESDVVPRDGLLRTAQWQGAAGYIIYAFTDRLSGALRAEIFDDMDGMRTLAAGVNGFGPGNQATYWEFTPTISYKVTDGLWWRNEYRHDESDTKKVFPRQNLFVRGQDTLATELVYTF